MTHPAASITRYDGWTTQFIPFEGLTEAQNFALHSLGLELNGERNPKGQRPRHIPYMPTPGGGYAFTYSDDEASSIEARIHKALEAYRRTTP